MIRNNGCNIAEVRQSCGKFIPERISTIAIMIAGEWIINDSKEFSCAHWALLAQGLYFLKRLLGLDKYLRDIFLEYLAYAIGKILINKTNRE